VGYWNGGVLETGNALVEDATCGAGLSLRPGGRSVASANNIKILDKWKLKSVGNLQVDNINLVILRQCAH
jgi:hypothetical protein